MAITQIISEENNPFYSIRELSEKTSKTEKEIIAVLSAKQMIYANPVVELIDPPFEVKGTINAGITTFVHLLGETREKLEKFRNLLSAQYTIYSWLTELDPEKFRNYDDNLGMVFWKWLENVISSTRNTEESTSTEWYDADRANTSDGGVDSYAKYEDSNQNLCSIILQSKSNKISGSTLRDLIGTISLVKNSSKYRKRYTENLSNCQIHTWEGLIVTSKDVSANWYLEKNRYSDDFNWLSFDIIEPWILSSHLCSKWKTILELETWDDEKLPDLLKVIRDSGKEPVQYW